MSKEEFSIVVTGIVNRNKKVLIAEKEESGSNPLSGQWHLPGTFLEDGENVRKQLEERLEEKTGLEVEPHQLIDFFLDSEGTARAVFHCEAGKGSAEAGDGIKNLEWVYPEDLESELGEFDSGTVLDRKEVGLFLEKLEKMPSV